MIEHANNWCVTKYNEIRVQIRDRLTFYASFETDYYGNDLDLAELACLFSGGDGSCDGVRIMVNVDYDTGTSEHAFTWQNGEWVAYVMAYDRGEDVPEARPLTFGQFCEALVDSIFYFEPL